MRECDVVLSAQRLLAPLDSVAAHDEVDAVVSRAEVVHGFPQVRFAGHPVELAVVTCIHAIASAHVDADERLWTAVWTRTVANVRHERVGTRQVAWTEYQLLSQLGSVPLKVPPRLVVPGQRRIAGGKNLER